MYALKISQKVLNLYNGPPSAISSSSDNICSGVIPKIDDGSEYIPPENLAKNSETASGSCKFNNNNAP